ncbi:unnamed protein product [Acanthoscelides obtectus]|nr:unnamed protein product [Acanthoscelides obtectus]CAK1665861.1 Probable cytochrome P450 6a23 [Acanthoscelides obtectus]
MLFPTLIAVDVEIVKRVLQVDFAHFWGHGTFINKTDNLSFHLFNLDGPKWKRDRAKLSPTFTSGKMKMMFQLIASCTDELTKVLDETSLNNPVDIKDIMSRFTTDVIGSCAFGIECNSLKDPNDDFRKNGRKVTDQLDFEGTVRQFLPFFVPHSLLKLTNFHSQNRSISSFYNRMVKATVNYRKDNNVVRKDFMQLLIELTEGEDPLNIDDIVAQCFLFFVAGFETSSSAISFACYELSLHPEIQQQVREEIELTLEKHGGKLTYEALMEMTYMDKVVYETLRKYPALQFLFRTCNKTYNIPDTDVTIDEGTKVIIPVLGIHYDPELYPDPDKFDPERFSEENKATRPSFTWLPFGDGPRICIGSRFGLLQTKLGLCTLLRRFRFTLNKKTKTPLVFSKAGILTSTEGNIWVDLEKIQ